MSEDILEVLRRKFTSGNEVPVERATITRKEYEAIVQRLEGADIDTEWIARTID